MSILIEGMKMPDKITQVILYPDGNVYVFRDVIDNDLKLKAVEIPTPHKRLIEEPEFFNLGGLCFIASNDFVGTEKYFMDQLRALPTIVGEEGQ